MAFEDVRFANGDCLFAGIYVSFSAGVRGRKVLLKETAELVRPTLRDKSFPLFIDDLYGEVDAGIEGLGHGLQRFMRYDRI